MTISAPVRSPAPRTLLIIRRILLATIVIGLTGTAAELLLLEHFEDWRQIIPLALIGAALLVLLWHAVDRRRTPIRVLQGVMVLLAISGVAGVLFHYQGNAEFELEMYPSRAGFELFAKSMMGATPALAPGMMTLLALIGLAYAHGHPRLTGVADDTGEGETR